MRVYLEKTDEYKEVKAKTIKEIVEKLKINTTTVIITKNNELVTEDAKITDKDEIKFLSVISGG